MSTDPAAEIAEALAEVRAVLQDHERRLFPVNRRGLPMPNGRLDRKYTGMVGDVWEVAGGSPAARGWQVICLDGDVEGNDCVYIHTPHSMYDPGADTVAMRPEQARLLAASILAAADRIESRSAKVVPLRAGEGS